MPRPSRARRDRHGRGLRGPLAPPQVPLARTRAERFDELILDAVERLERIHPERLRGVEFAVEDVPPAVGASLEDPADPVPLGRSFPATPARPPRIVVYRWPLESRASDPADLAALVHDVVVERVADLLGLTPEQVDPRYGERDDD